MRPANGPKEIFLTSTITLAVTTSPAPLGNGQGIQRRRLRAYLSRPGSRQVVADVGDVDHQARVLICIGFPFQQHGVTWIDDVVVGIYQGCRKAGYHGNGRLDDHGDRGRNTLTCTVRGSEGVGCGHSGCDTEAAVGTAGG